MDRDIGYSLVLDTAYGRMIVNRNDINQAGSLFLSGLSPDHKTICLLSEVVSAYPGHPHVLDIGANIGTYSLALSRKVQPGGRIYAFEPQRIIFNMLAGSVALNSINNIFCSNIALGDRDDEIEIPQFDYSKRLNFGSIEFGREQKETLHQQRGNDPAARETVPLVRVDSLGFSGIGLMKIDVEGMEQQVIDGSIETINRCRPMVFIETLKTDATNIREMFSSIDYQITSAGPNDFYVPREIAV